MGSRLPALASALGGMRRDGAAPAAGMDRQSLRDRVHRHDARGSPARGAGRPACVLDGGRRAAPEAVIPRGPRPERDGRVAWRARELVERRFGVHHGEGRGQTAAARARPPLEGAAGPPRGRPEGAGASQENLPGLIEAVACQHPGEPVGPWFVDGAHVGRKGGVTSLGRQERVCPRGARRQGSSSAHLSGAVRPERGGYVALVPPGVSTAATGVFPAELARAVPAGTRAALVLDGAGRHVRGGRPCRRTRP